MSIWSFWYGAWFLSFILILIFFTLKIDLLFGSFTHVSFSFSHSSPSLYSLDFFSQWVPLLLSDLFVFALWPTVFNQGHLHVDQTTHLAHGQFSSDSTTKNKDSPSFSNNELPISAWPVLGPMSLSFIHNWMLTGPVFCRPCAGKQQPLRIYECSSHIMPRRQHLIAFFSIVCLLPSSCPLFCDVLWPSERWCGCPF